MEFILISPKASKKRQMEKNSDSESKTDTISVCSNALIVGNQVNHFDIKNCTPKAIYN